MLQNNESTLIEGELIPASEPPQEPPPPTISAMLNAMRDVLVKESGVTATQREAMARCIDLATDPRRDWIAAVRQTDRATDWRLRYHAAVLMLFYLSRLDVRTGEIGIYEFKTDSVRPFTNEEVCAYTGLSRDQVQRLHRLFDRAGFLAFTEWRYRKRTLTGWTTAATKTIQVRFFALLGMSDQFVKFRKQCEAQHAARVYANEVRDHEQQTVINRLRGRWTGRKPAKPKAAPAKQRTRDILAGVKAVQRKVTEKVQEADFITKHTSRAWADDIPI